MPETPDTDYFRQDEDEQIRRLNLCYHRYPQLEQYGLSPTALVMNGLVPGDFDIDAEGNLYAVSERGAMMVEASVELMRMVGPPDPPGTA